MGWRQTLALKMYAKSPVFHSTLPRPILLSNSNCHLFYLNLVDIAMFRLRTVWKRLRQIYLPFSVHELKKTPFILMDNQIWCSTQYVLPTWSDTELPSTTQFHVYLNSIKAPWHPENAGVNIYSKYVTSSSSTADALVLCLQSTVVSVRSQQTCCLDFVAPCIFFERLFLLDIKFFKTLQDTFFLCEDNLTLRFN